MPKGLNYHDTLVSHAKHALVEAFGGLLNEYQQNKQETARSI